MKYSGTISISPPTATTRTMSAISSAWLRSIRSWVSFMGVSRSLGVRRCGNPRLEALAIEHGLENVVGHQQHPGEVQHAAEQAYGVERIGRLDAFDEGVGQRSVRAHRAPHQAL